MTTDSTRKRWPATEDAKGVVCPKCGCAHLPVLNARRSMGRILRYRQCRHCGRRVFAQVRGEPVASLAPVARHRVGRIDLTQRPSRNQPFARTAHPSAPLVVGREWLNCPAQQQPPQTEIIVDHKPTPRSERSQKPRSSLPTISDTAFGARYRR